MIVVASKRILTHRLSEIETEIISDPIVQSPD